MEFSIKYKPIDNLDIKDPILCKLHHDINGNVYLSHDNTLFMMSIGKNNDIEFYNISHDKLESTTNKPELIYGNIIDTEGTSLKKKTMDRIEKDDDSDREEEYQNYQEKIKCYREDRYYCTDDRKHDSDDENEEYFDFYKKDGDNSIELMDNYFDGMSLYDTFIREQNKNVIVSLLFSNGNSYRISIYKKHDDNSILLELNIVGDQIKFFDPYYCLEDNFIQIMTESKIA